MTLMKTTNTKHFTSTGQSAASFHDAKLADFLSAWALSCLLVYPFKSVAEVTEFQ